jgi:hypothetical protein
MLADAGSPVLPILLSMRLAKAAYTGIFRAIATPCMPSHSAVFRSACGQMAFLRASK